jgi:hypothetical protein
MWSFSKNSISLSTFSSNSADLGGAIRVGGGGELSLSSSTLSNNTANDNGGGLSGERPAKILNSTIVDNSAPVGAGIWQTEQTLTLTNSIIANRTSENSTNCESDNGTHIVSEGHNLSSDDSCNLTANSDLNNTQPQLAALSLNGSTTASHSPLADSPAIDAGDNAMCAAAPVNGLDQRGVGRPQPDTDTASCDIGAVEYTANGIAGNQGFSGLWWEPARSGQGVNLWQRGNTLFGAWYVYDADGQDLWVTFSGNLSGGTITSPLTLSSGPALGKLWDVSQVSNTSVGTMTLLFSSDQQATFAYTLLGNSGSLNLQPFIIDPANAEDGTSAGFWWNPAKSGQGLNLWHKGDQLFGVWFLYDEVGAAQWVTFNGIHDGESMPKTGLTRHSGPTLGSSWDTSLLSQTDVGNVDIEFDLNTIRFSYTLNGVSETIDLIPFYP